MSGFTGNRVSATPDHPDRQPADPSSAANGGSPDRGDEDDMGSPSEHNAEQQYGHSSIGESEKPGPDVHYALTSQSLNTDGTPKRPMNAFMIFARRRRPQVSAANQMMRTGEISKILSKEWNSMPMVEKQFYLDQAKKLKDTFNSKYPDYVYRRRPNNSRRKRRADGSMGRPFDGSGGGGDHHDDSASTEFDGESPVEVASVSPAHTSAPALAYSDSGLLGSVPLGAAMATPHPHVSHPHVYTRSFPPPALPPTATASGGSDHAVSPTYDTGPASASSHSSSSSYTYPPHYADEFASYHAHTTHSATAPTTGRLSHMSWPESTAPQHSPVVESMHSHHYAPQHHAHAHAHAHHHASDHLPPPHTLAPHSPEEPASAHSLWTSGGGNTSTSRFDPTGRTTSVSAGVAPGSSSGWPGLTPSLPSVSAPTSGRTRSLTGSVMSPTSAVSIISGAGAGAGAGGGAGAKQSEIFSPTVPHRAWSNTPSSGSSASAASVSAAAAAAAAAAVAAVSVTGGPPSLQFQTLTAPFFPQPPSGSAGGGPSGGAGSNDTRSASTSPIMSRDPYYSSGGRGGGGGGGESSAYDTLPPPHAHNHSHNHNNHNAYPISPISPPHNSSYYSTGNASNGAGNPSGGASHLYPPSRGAHLLNPIATYSPGGPGGGGGSAHTPSARDMASPLSAGPHSAASQGAYWERVPDNR